MTPPASPEGGPGRPARWPALLAIGTLVGGVLVNIASNELSVLARQVLGPASIAVTAVAAVAFVLFEVRRRRAERLVGPDTGAGSSGGAPTLPYLTGFTGRAEQVGAIVGAVKREHAVAVVGRRAVGTSFCAVQAANVFRDDYPDGQFYLDLRAGGRRRTTRSTLTALARILGTTAPRSGRPGDLLRAADALRGHLDGKRILLVLDNVDDPAQVWPLLPPTARTCRLLLVGAPALANLGGVVAHRLTEPDPDDAVALFAAAAGNTHGPRARRPDPRTDLAVREIVELCGRQPRTIWTLGSQAARHGWPSTELLKTLRRAAEAPPHQHLPYSPAVSLLTERDTAYAALSGGARRLYRLMSLSPVALDRPTIAALARRGRHRVAALLDELAGGFVVGAPGDRYEIRPLLTGYARLHLRNSEPGWRRTTAQARLARHLARRAERHAASLAVTSSLAGRDQPLPLDDPAGWFELNQELLLATVRVPAGAAQTLPRWVRRWWFRVAVALCGWYAHEERLDEWAAVCRMVLDTPTADDRPEIAGWAHNELGVLRRRQHDPQGAAVALTLAVAERGRRGTAQARMNLGLALLDLGQLDDAIEHLELSRRHRSTVDRAGHALTDLGLGAAHLARDEPETAHHHLVRAANTFRSIGEMRGYAAALTNLVLVHGRLGEHLDAAQAWRAALREYDTTTTDLGARATALLNAGATLMTTTPARAGQAYELLGESRRLREQWRPTAGLGRTLLYLGDAAYALGRTDEARRHWADAAGVCEAVDDPAGLAAADARPLVGGPP
ncbi:tetratricopeptide repeat protein [Micromonospora sp. NBC_01699]|uniref:tetratricopeptide repeat protein n=1 Tax=Micromonospora sp. NBC_01699 TaxID=2975984 RepID=UPI002E3816E3|nr:tetratricopeptide repeat protein [Micromonospora sp. NBC_01699]